MIWKLSKVCEMTGLKKSSIYKLMAEQDFPQSVKLTAKSRGWIAAEVIGWIEQRQAAR